MMPILSSRNIPSILKIGLTLTVGLILLPLVKIDPRYLPREPFQFGSLMIAELMIGFILSLSVQIIFAGIQMGGELVSFQMGFSMATVVDPPSEVSTPVISEFIYLHGHACYSWPWMRIIGFSGRFIKVSSSWLPGEIHLRAGLYTHFLNLVGNLFVIAVKLAAPVSGGHDVHPDRPGNFGQSSSPGEYPDDQFFLDHWDWAAVFSLFH